MTWQELFFYDPIVVCSASIGCLMSYRLERKHEDRVDHDGDGDGGDDHHLGALRMIPPDPAKHVRVKSQRKRRSRTIAMYFQSSITCNFQCLSPLGFYSLYLSLPLSLTFFVLNTSLSLSLSLICCAMNWTPCIAFSTLEQNCHLHFCIFTYLHFFIHNCCHMAFAFPSTST